MKYLIIANGVIINKERLLKYINEADYVAAADGGLKHLRRLGMMPDVLIGDMDSIEDHSIINNCDYFTTDKKDRSNNNVKQCKIIQYPKKKDAGDTELAVQWAIDNGADDITLLGVTGTRIDHTLSNIFLLKTIIEQGVKCRIVDDYNEIYILSDNKPATSCYSISIQGKIGGLLSIIPLTEKVTGITLEGLEYPLDNAALEFGQSRGISNVFIKEYASISLKQGCLLITKSSDELLPYL